MRRMIIYFLNIKINKAIKKLEIHEKNHQPVLAHAYRNMIKNYKDTIMFLKAQRSK